MVGGYALGVWDEYWVEMSFVSFDPKIYGTSRTVDGVAMDGPEDCNSILLNILLWYKIEYAI